MLSTALYRADDSEDPLTRVAGATGELPGEPVSYYLSGLCVLLYVVFIYGIIATTRPATTDRVLAKIPHWWQRLRTKVCKLQDPVDLSRLFVNRPRVGLLALFHSRSKCLGGNTSLARSLGFVCGIEWCPVVFCVFYLYRIISAFEVTIIKLCGKLWHLRNRHFEILSWPEARATWFHSQLKCSGGNTSLALIVGFVCGIKWYPIVYFCVLCVS